MPTAVAIAAAVRPPKPAPPPLCKFPRRMRTRYFCLLVPAMNEKAFRRPESAVQPRPGGVVKISRSRVIARHIHAHHRRVETRVVACFHAERRERDRETRGGRGGGEGIF